MAPLPSFAAGAMFGTALLASGVYAPSVITSQFQLDNFHMMQTFLAATGSSALVIKLAQRSGYAACPARTPSSYGYFAYDANLVGGLLVGTGMALTGACPGTVLVQIATGVRSGVFVGLGGILGGVLYTGFAERLRRGGVTAAKASPSPSPSSSSTLPGLFKADPTTILLLYELMMLLAIAGSNALAPRHPHWLHPVLGGILIGAAQAASIVLTQRPVGVSTAYQDLGRRFWRTLTGSYATAPTLTPAVSFALGILAGSALLTHSPSFVATAGLPASSGSIDALPAALGGAVMVFGAGLAGGCPSGHGISGLSTFGVASFVSVAAMFGGGIAVALATK